MSDTPRFDSRTIALHWLSAAAIAVMWLLGQTIDFFPRDQRYLALSTHVALGFALVAIIAARLSWRLGGGQKLPPAEAGALGKAAIGVHHLLYLLILVVLGLGLAVEAMRGDFLFHLIQLPLIAPVDRTLRRAVNGYHALLADGLVILAVLHAAAAIWHHVVKRDGVLLRMR